MVYGIERIIKDVRIVLDENTSGLDLLLEQDIDTLSLEQIIVSKIEDAVETVHKSVPLYMLEQGHNIRGAVYWGDRESGWIKLPHDFMRLICFEMSDWEQPVSEAISVSDPRYKLQRQRVKALRGTAQKPVCVITERPTGRVLEFYSCKSEDAEVRRAQYIPYPKIDSNGGIDISERCYRAAVYMIAALTAITFGENEKGTALQELSKMAMI